MIVMKFGGASLASPASITRVAAIVHSQLQRGPIVIVSALGETTDQLLRILKHASRGEAYLACKLQEEVKTYHFCVAEDLLRPKTLEPVDQYIRQVFRDLHVRMLEICEGERSVTPELTDWVASLGEQLASRIVSAALSENRIPAKHLKSEELILTDERFTTAAPRYWETYARIRWSVPIAARSHVVVLAGFLGATEDGRITTLGRGGSDLTASIVGAAVNAEEIQVWKNVDGMLTWDPKLKSGAYRVTSLSYEEASELAQAGAVILHPETVAPAQRLRIPVVIRNTFRPGGEGTRIGITKIPCTSPVKSIAYRSNLTLVEIRSPKAEGIPPEYLRAIEHACHDRKTATLLAVSDDTLYLALDGSDPDPGRDFAFDHCTQVHVRPDQAIVTLVGDRLKRCNVLARLSTFLLQRGALVLPQNGESCSVQIVIRQEELSATMDVLERAFFTEPDPAFFAAAESLPEQQPVASAPGTRLDRGRQLLALHRSRFA
jgi:aspartate kinase